VIVALDAEAINRLAGSDTTTSRRVHEALETAERVRATVIVPTVVLAELYRGRSRAQQVDAMLARNEKTIALRNTDQDLARFVGATLHAAGLGSEHIVDAHVVATVVEGGGGIAVTGDPDDLARLAAAYGTAVVVRSI
jgi:predicted nucleic acid-binding protein